MFEAMQIMVLAFLALGLPNLVLISSLIRHEGPRLSAGFNLPVLADRLLRAAKTVSELSHECLLARCLGKFESQQSHRKYLEESVPCALSGTGFWVSRVWLLPSPGQAARVIPSRCVTSATIPPL